MKNIRNFAIIAHVDHGKSTLADRLIELCGNISNREMKNQILDSMPLERERGITIKAQTVRLNYKAKDGNEYQLNIIDTPGHVDFSYEVSRSLIACESSLLIIDATQGVEAQTISNVYHAIEENHEIMPVLNKIDLPSAEPDKVIKELEEMIGIDGSNSIMVSAKRGIGINELLEKIVTDLPAPDGDPNAPLRALLIDSWYDVYLGIVILIRVKDGCISLGDDITMMSNNKKYIVDRLGIFNPKMEKCQTLYSGEIGFITAAIKDIEETAIGDTITHTKNPTLSPFPGFKSSNPVVFCGIFPKDETNFSEMKKSIAKLKLNDNSFHYEVEKSTALGTGFRCGFLGLLHMDIICERLRRESNIDLVATAPSVVYKVVMKDGKVIEIYNPSDLPDPSEIQHIEEPWIKGTVITSADYLGAIITLCEEKRGEHINLTYVNNQVMLEYNLPLNEIVFDFNDSVKSLSKGFASFNYELSDYRPGKLVKVSIIVHNNIVDGLSFITHYDKAPQQGRDVCSKLKDLIQRHQFKIAIQAAIGGKIIARETIAGFRKGVTDKLYGGDRTRKMKLLEKQKEGKKRMEGLGKVNIPQSAFLAVAQVNKK